MNNLPENMGAWHDKSLFGFWLYILSDCVLFAGLFATYAVLCPATFGHAGPQELLNLPFVLAETIVLLISNLCMGLALASSNNKNRVLALLLGALVFGLLFLGLELHEFSNLIAEGNGPQASAFLSSFFGLVGTHGLHVALGSLWMVVVMLHIYRRGVEANSTKLRMLGLFWHFLDIIWIFIFSIVYLLSATL